MCEVERKIKNQMDGRCKRALNERGMSVEQGRMIVHHKSEWRAMVNA